jgi:uncharacterized protein YndB with AHSA1/START domain
MSYELTVERLIDAYPEEVFDAYTDPDAQREWFTILDEGMIVEIDVDFRVGGKWEAAWGFSLEEMFRETQTFVVIDRPHRLVTKSTGSSPDGQSLDTEVEITFRDESGKTLMTVSQTGFSSEEERDFFARTAWIGFFDRFQAYLAARTRA